MKDRRSALWLALFLVAASSAEAEEWVGARSPHFMVICDGSEKSARRVASEFEQFRALFQTLIGVRVDPGNVRVNEALELVEKALKMEPHDASFLDSRGWALHRLGREKEAEESLREALGRGDSPVILGHLGDVLEARSALEDAIAQWLRAKERTDTPDELREALSAKIESARTRLRAEPAVDPSP